MQGNQQKFWTLIMMRTIYIKLKRRVLKKLNKNMNGVSMRLNTKRKINKGLKTKMIWHVYMEKKQIKYLNAIYYMV